MLPDLANKESCHDSSASFSSRPRTSTFEIYIETAKLSRKVSFVIFSPQFLFYG